MAAPISAQPLDERTLFTFSERVTLPGVAPAGQYLAFDFVSPARRSSFTRNASQTLTAAGRPALLRGVASNDDLGAQNIVLPDSVV